MTNLKHEIIASIAERRKTWVQLVKSVPFGEELSEFLFGCLCFIGDMGGKGSRWESKKDNVLCLGSEAFGIAPVDGW